MFVSRMTVATEVVLVPNLQNLEKKTKNICKNAWHIGTLEKAGAFSSTENKKGNSTKTTRAR